MSTSQCFLPPTHPPRRLFMILNNPFKPGLWRPQEASHLGNKTASCTCAHLQLSGPHSPPRAHTHSPMDSHVFR